MFLHSSADFPYQIIPAFTTVTRSSASRVQDFHLQQLAILVGIIKDHVREFMGDIVQLITDLWDNRLLQLPLVVLIESLGKVLDDEFKHLLPTILPLLLKVFNGDVSEKNEKHVSVQIKIFDAFFTFGSSIEEYMHVVIPIVVRTYEKNEEPLSLRKKAVQLIDGLSRKVSLSDHASRIIHPLVRVLKNCTNELRLVVVDCLCSMVIRLESDFVIFIPTIQKASEYRRSGTTVLISLLTRLFTPHRRTTPSTRT
jgi:serine/threonine-protein kinase mTOR